VLVVGALVGLVAGCGGDDDRAAGDTSAQATSTTIVVDRSTWSEQLDAACSELDADYSDLAIADPTDRDDAIAHAAQVSDFAGEFEAILDEIDPAITLPVESIGLPRGHQHGPRPVTVPEGFWDDRDSAEPLAAGADAYTSGG